MLHVMLRRAAAAAPARGWPGKIESQKLADFSARAGIRLRLARVGAVYPERQVVAVACADGAEELGYDSLLHALGSHGDGRSVPGVAEHAFDVAARPAVLRLRERLDGTREGGVWWS